MEGEKRWLEDQVKRNDLSEETRLLRQSQLDSIKIVAREVTISEWR